MVMSAEGRDMYADLGLPNITGSHAWVARSIGDFGSVPAPFTNRYHTAHTFCLVILVWSGHGLPFFTVPVIWVRAYRVRPLPTFTTVTGDWRL